MKCDLKSAERRNNLVWTLENMGCKRRCAHTKVSLLTETESHGREGGKDNE
jgi:hypothetical protein